MMNKLWAEMVMGRNGYGPKWSWAEMVMGRNDPESLIKLLKTMHFFLGVRYLPFDNIVNMW